MIIAFSRQAGSGGNDIALLVAQRLQLQLIGREQIDQAAAAVGVGRYPLEESREPQLASHMVEILVHGIEPRGRPATPGEGFPSTRDPKYRSLVASLLRELMKRSSAVVVGAGAQWVLHGDPRTVRVFVIAPSSMRIRNIAMREDLELETAERVVRESDRDRTDYVRRYYQARWDDPLAYDLVLNTAAISVGQATEAVVVAARVAIP